MGVFPFFRFTALSLLPGQTPTQLARLFGDGNTSRSDRQPWLEIHTEHEPQRIDLSVGSSSSFVLMFVVRLDFVSFTERKATASRFGRPSPLMKINDSLGDMTAKHRHGPHLVEPLPFGFRLGSRRLGWLCFLEIQAAREADDWTADQYIRHDGAHDGYDQKLADLERL